MQPEGDSFELAEGWREPRAQPVGVRRTQPRVVLLRDRAGGVAQHEWLRVAARAKANQIDDIDTKVTRQCLDVSRPPTARTGKSMEQHQRLAAPKHLIEDLDRSDLGAPAVQEAVSRQQCVLLISNKTFATIPPLLHQP